MVEKGTYRDVIELLGSRTCGDLGVGIVGLKYLHHLSGRLGTRLQGL